jgi:hypothetical protein
MPACLTETLFSRLGLSAACHKLLRDVTEGAGVLSPKADINAEAPRVSQGPKTQVERLA